MVDVFIFGVLWEEIVNWYLAQPIYGQILFLVGVIALLALAVVIVYYILKGVAYLVYYIIKGVYYLLKGIGLLFYKIFEALYYAISGEPKPECFNPAQEQQAPPQVEKQPEPINLVQKTYQTVNPDVAFCSECGSKFSSSMIQTLSNKEFVYCIHCGKGFQSISMHIES
jgi:DNA-directed RNA polymerase subunit RPC12/RpoP